MSNTLSFMYNASAYTQTWGTGMKTLTTGVASLRMHFGPMSSRLARTPFGATSQFLGVCDRGLGIRPGDIVYITEYGGVLSPPRRFRVDGVADYYHQYGLLDHMNLALSEHVQN